MATVNQDMTLSRLAATWSRFSGIGATFVVRGASAAGVMLVTMIVAKAVSVESAAQIFLFMAASTGLSIMARFGSELHVLRRVAARKALGGLRNYFVCLTYLLSISSAAACVLWIAYAAIGREVGVKQLEFLIYVPLMAVLTNVSQTCSFWLKGLGKPALGSVFEASGYCIFLLPWLLATTVISPSKFYACSTFISLILSVVGVGLAIRYSRMDAKVHELGSNNPDTRLTDLIRECFPLAIFAALSFLSQWGMLFLADMQRNSVLVSELNVMVRLVAPLLFIQHTLESYLAPKFATAQTAQQLKRLRRNGVLVMLAVALPMSLPFWIVPDVLVGFLFGQAYIGLSAYVPFVFLSMMLFGCLGSNIIVLAARDSRMAMMAFSFARVIVVLGLTVLLLPKLGALGGVIAYLSGMAVQALLARLWVDRSLSDMSFQVPVQGVSK